MYYESWEVSKKIIKVDGFNFILKVHRDNWVVNVEINDIYNKFIDATNISDESEVNTAIEILNQSIYEWIENNTDEADRIINKVLGSVWRWGYLI